VLSQEVEKSKTYLDRVRDQTVREVSSSLDTASSDDIKL
jgi:hypothetical protein